jgi:hypothetical protein
MIDWLAAFGGMAVLDATWAFYTIALVKRDHHWAGVTSAMLFILGAVVIRMYVDDGWIIIPAALGAFVGTEIGSRYAIH